MPPSLTKSRIIQASPFPDKESPRPMKRSRAAFLPPSSARKALIAIAGWLLVALALASCSGAKEDPRPDVILITVDSLRADAPGFMGGKVETPAMDALASKGAVFTQAISPVPQTLPSMASLQTGLYPRGTGVHDDGVDRLADGKETLAGLLKKAGYRTAAFPAALALHPKHGLDRGFDEYLESFAEIPRPRSSPAIGIPARRIVDRAIEWLGAAPPEKRYFLWINLFDPHFFYEPPSPYKETYADRPYDGEVAETDHELSRLLRWLSDHGRDPKTLIVLAGNHGEALGEKGEEYHGILLRETTLRVPLVILSPGAAPVKVQDPVSLVDVAPTIAALAGVQASGMDGVSLAGYLGAGQKPKADRPIYFETLMPRTLFGWLPLRGVREGALKYVEAPGTSHVEMYDVGADPGEDHDLAPARPADRDRLAAFTLTLGGPAPAEAALTEAQASVVRSLDLPVSAPPPAPILPASLVGAGTEALKAHRSFQRQLIQSAVFLFQDVLKQDPANHLALLDFGSIYFGARDAAHTHEYFSRAQALYPADGEVYHLMGHLAIATARSAADAERARKLFELAVRLDPLNEEALYDAACSVAGINPDLALDYLDQSVKNGFRDFSYMARDGDLDPLRTNARFDSITGGKAIRRATGASGASGPAGGAAQPGTPAAPAP